MYETCAVHAQYVSSLGRACNKSEWQQLVLDDWFWNEEIGGMTRVCVESCKRVLAELESQEEAGDDGAEKGDVAAVCGGSDDEYEGCTVNSYERRMLWAELDVNARLRAACIERLRNWDHDTHLMMAHIKPRFFQFNQMGSHGFNFPNNPAFGFASQGRGAPKGCKQKCRICKAHGQDVFRRGHDCPWKAPTGE